MHNWFLVLICTFNWFPVLFVVVHSYRLYRNWKKCLNFRNHRQKVAWAALVSLYIIEPNGKSFLSLFRKKSSQPFFFHQTKHHFAMAPKLPLLLWSSSINPQLFVPQAVAIIFVIFYPQLMKQFIYNLNDNKTPLSLGMRTILQLEILFNVDGYQLLCSK